MMRFAGPTLLILIASAAPGTEPVDYARQVRPILKHHCYACHGPLQQKAGLRLDTAAALRKGSENGSVISLDQPDKSALLARVSTTDLDQRMPPKDEGTPLNSDEIAILRNWIAGGATPPEKDEPEADPRDHWSYQTPSRPALPAVRESATARNAIDYFLSAAREERGLAARPEAPRDIWLRRVTLDLVGVPPTRDELHAFLSDESPDAHERLVDRLLARPDYGERWGRHWMDVWRYSDWYGSRNINEIRYSQRHIWRWRDWIVESLAKDKPYDRMIHEMLAGDELAPADPDVLRATGFIGRNWYKFDRNVWMFDLVEHTGQAFMAMTLKCARCHDHKFDPLTHEDYYRFRALFEPHDVRTDALRAGTPTEKDATLGQVLKEGVARVYDKQLDVPTYVFQRGDSRYPDKSKPLTPGIPAILSRVPFSLEPIQLPADSYYPALKPALREGLMVQANTAIQQAEQAVIQAKAKESEAAQNVAEFISRNGETTVKPAITFQDDFSKARPEDWTILGGNWVYENGELVQKTAGSFLTVVSQKTHPRDFRARWKFRTLEGGAYGSVGFSFDYVDQGQSQDVYTHLNATSQGVQAFHRTGGKQEYPAAGIVKTTNVLKFGAPATVEITVRGLQLTIWLNGEKRLDYVLPIARRDGKFALWVHAGAAAFDELEIQELVPTLDDLRREAQAAADAAANAEQSLVVARKELESLTARTAAEVAKYSSPPAGESERLALAASRAEREVAAAKAAQQTLLARQQVRRVKAAEPPGAAASPALVDAEKKLQEAEKAEATAREAIAKADGKYAPLGEIYPATSTGRRLALAKWITHPDHPRTARVAANHIWLRHFGQALVPTPDNFGANGQPPTHPELLDWLARELIESGWQMKRLHRLLVLSAAYRMDSLPGFDETNQRLDRENRYLWRMNSRRMEAEVVRDSVLAVAGGLDRQFGGPEIPEKEGQASPRRSLYFRLTPNEKMKFLELFDAADPNGCYRRRESVVPQQALALMNSALALDQARALATAITGEVGEADTPETAQAFIAAAFEQVLSRSPSADESRICLKFLADGAGAAQAPAAFPAGGESRRSAAAQPHLRARENLVHVLFSHNDFVTIR